MCYNVKGVLLTVCKFNLGKIMVSKEVLVSEIFSLLSSTDSLNVDNPVHSIVKQNYRHVVTNHDVIELSEFTISLHELVKNYYMANSLSMYESRKVSSRKIIEMTGYSLCYLSVLRDIALSHDTIKDAYIDGSLSYDGLKKLANMCKKNPKLDFAEIIGEMKKSKTTQRKINLRFINNWFNTKNSNAPDEASIVEMMEELKKNLSTIDFSALTDKDKRKLVILYLKLMKRL
jgi:hypothetical protein